MIQFEPGYPAARAIASQIAQLDQAITREESRVSSSFQSAYRDAAGRERALASRVDGLKTGLIDLKRRSIQYNIFQRDVDTNRQLYDGLLQRYKEIGIAGGVGTNNVSIVDVALTPDGPSQPRMINNLLLSLLIGLVIGAGLAFALEQIDEAIADPADVESALGLPLLGAVPQTGDVEPMVALQDRNAAGRGQVHDGVCPCPVACAREAQGGTDRRRHAVALCSRPVWAEKRSRRQQRPSGE
jgi:polysaccharide biosynthesis transport protein